MNKIRLTLTAAVLLASLAAAQPASAYWTFLTYTSSGFAMCTGEQDYPGGGPYCDVSTSWGTRVQTSTFGSQCAATVTCDSGLAHTCLANQNSPFGLPSICWSSTADGGHDRVVCKSSTGGNWSAFCS